MKMSKILSLVLALVMLLSCLVACGPKKPDQGNTDTPNPLAGTYDIQMWVSEKKSEDGTQSVALQMENQIKDFMAANPGIVINAKISGVTEADAGSQVVADVASAPDIFCFAQDQLARLVQASALAAPGGDVANLLKAENDPYSVAAATVAGTLYAYPMTSDNGYYLYYDKSVVTNPDSLEAIIADCDAAYAANAEHKYFRFALENGWYTASFFFGAGAHSQWTMDSEGNFNNVDDNFNSDAGMIAMQGMYKLAHAQSYNPDADNFDGAAAIVTGIWNAESAEAHFGENLGIADLPSFNVDGKDYHLGSFSGFKLMGVKPQTDSKRGAVLQLLAQYLTSEKCQLERYNMWQWGPSNVKAQQSDAVKANPSLAALAAQNEYAIPQGQIHGSWWDMAANLGKAAKAAQSNDDLKGALVDYESALNAVLNMTDEQKAAWGVIGNICGTSWDTDLPMTKVSEGRWESDALDLVAGQEFKLRQGASWDVQVGANGEMNNGANIVVETSGKFVVVLEWDGKSTPVVTLLPA